MDVNEMTDSHIRNAWAFLFCKLNFGVDDGVMDIFDGFRKELKRRGQWNLKLELQYKDLGTRNKIHRIAENISYHNMHGHDFE